MRFDYYLILFGSTIHSWTIVRELDHDKPYKLGFEQICEISIIWIRHRQLNSYVIIHSFSGSHSYFMVCDLIVWYS